MMAHDGESTTADGGRCAAWHAAACCSRRSRGRPADWRRHSSLAASRPVSVAASARARCVPRARRGPPASLPADTTTATAVRPRSSASLPPALPRPATPCAPACFSAAACHRSRLHLPGQQQQQPPPAVSVGRRRCMISIPTCNNNIPFLSRLPCCMHPRVAVCARGLAPCCTALPNAARGRLPRVSACSTAPSLTTPRLHPRTFGFMLIGKSEHPCALSLRIRHRLPIGFEFISSTRNRLSTGCEFPTAIREGSANRRRSGQITSTQ